VRPSPPRAKTTEDCEGRESHAPHSRLLPLPHGRRRARTCRHRNRSGKLRTHAARGGRGAHPQRRARARSSPVVKRGARRLARGPRDELVGRQRSHACLLRGRWCRRRLVERRPRAPLRHPLTACARRSATKQEICSTSLVSLTNWCSRTSIIEKDLCTALYILNQTMLVLTVNRHTLINLVVFFKKFNLFFAR
jgi:hypothetical protein